MRGLRFPQIVMCYEAPEFGSRRFSRPVICRRRRRSYDVLAQRFTTSLPCAVRKRVYVDPRHGRVQQSSG